MKTSSRSALIAPAILLLFVASQLVARAEEKIEHTKDSPETVKKLVEQNKAILLDVREKQEWDAGHLEQARLVPLSKLKEGVDPKTMVKDLEKKPIVYCHCQVGRRAITAAEILKKMGYDARPLKQGYKELAEAGLPKSK